jgi:spore coat protein U-like protein
MYALVSAPATTPPGTYTSSFSGENFFWGLNVLGCGGITVGYSVVPATFTFTGTVSSNCIVSATAMSFGTVGLLTTAASAQNQISATCTATTPYTLGLDNGLAGTSPTARKMVNGASQVTYGIYQDANHTQPWGTVSLGLSYVESATGIGSAQPFTAYGMVPVQTTPAPNTYSDTVVATATY